MPQRPQTKLRRSLVPIVAAYGAAFSGHEGKAVLEDMEASFGGSCYTKGDPYDTAFREGQREVLLRIRYMLSLGGLEVEEEEEGENA